MASGLESLQLKLQSIFDPKGFTDAKDAVKGTAEHVGGLTQKLDGAASSLSGLGAAIGALLGGAAIASFLTEAAQGAYEDEKAIRGLTTAAKVYGANLSEVTVSAKEFTEALSAQAGVADSDLMGALSRAYMATGDLEQAQLRVKLAAEISTKSNKTFEEAMNLVARTAEGAGEKLLKLEGIHTKGTTAAEKAQDGLDKLSKLYGSTTTAIEDNALALDRSRAKWQNFKDSVGADVLPIIVKAREGLTYLYDAIILLASKGINELMGFGKALGAWFDALPTLFKKGFTAAWTQLKADTDRIRAETRETNEQLDEQMGERVLKREERTSTALNQLNDKKLKAGKDLADKQIAQEERFTKTYLELLKARHAAETNADKKLLIEKQILDEMRKLELRELQKAGELTRAKMDEVDKKYDHLWAARLEKRRVEWSDEQRAEYEAHIKNLMEQSRADDARQKWLEQLKDRKERDDERAAAAEINLQNQVVDQSLALGAQVFGQNKAFQAASAIVDTYRAAAGQLATPPVGPWNIALAAVMIATGLANVAQIMAAHPTGGKGFDDPNNDYAAYLGGRKWAKDMIGMFSAGATSAASAGWASGMGSSSSQTIDNSRHINVTMQGAGLMDPTNVEMVKQFSRTLRNVERNIESQRTLGRAR